jgi:hypothetical protein
MKKFQYQIVRYIHDRVTSEFVNIGVIVYQPEANYLQSKFINKFSRISQFFVDINGQYLLATLKQFEREINIYADRLNELFSDHSSLAEITNSILPKDDSALVCSELFYCIDINEEAAIEGLYDRLVNKYNHDANKEHHDDKFVWKKYYKQYFDKYGITNKLKPHSVKTNHDEIEFDKAWKNGSWNCYQTLSLDLKRTEAIKNKVYKWKGILSELEDSHEKLHLYFLTVSPSRNKGIKKFIHDTLPTINKKTLQVTLIDIKEADKFAATLKKEIEKHEAGIK